MLGFARIASTPRMTVGRTGTLDSAASNSSRTISVVRIRNLPRASEAATARPFNGSCGFKTATQYPVSANTTFTNAPGRFRTPLHQFAQRDRAVPHPKLRREQRHRWHLAGPKWGQHFRRTSLLPHWQVLPDQPLRTASACGPMCRTRRCRGLSVAQYDVRAGHLALPSHG